MRDAALVDVMPMSGQGRTPSGVSSRSEIIRDSLPSLTVVPAAMYQYEFQDPDPLHMPMWGVPSMFRSTPYGVL